MFNLKHLKVRVRVRALRRLGLLVPLHYEQYLDAATLFHAAFPPLFVTLPNGNGGSENPLVRYVAALANTAYVVRTFLMNASIPPIALDCARYNLEDEARKASEWLRQLREKSKDAAVMDAAAMLADMTVLYTYDVEFALEVLEDLLKEEKEELRCIRQRVQRARIILADALWE